MSFVSSPVLMFQAGFSALCTMDGLEVSEVNEELDFSDINDTADRCDTPGC